MSLSLTLLVEMTLDADEGSDLYDRALMGVLLVTINIAVGVIGLLGLLSTLPCFGGVMERILAKKRPEKKSSEKGKLEEDEQLEQQEIDMKSAADIPSRAERLKQGKIGGYTFYLIEEILSSFPTTTKSTTNQIMATNSIACTATGQHFTR